MINKDLNYIYNNTKSLKRNIYPHKLTKSTIPLQIKFLKENELNFEIEHLKEKKGRIIHLKDKENKNIGTIERSAYPSNSKLGKYLTSNKLKTEQHLKKFNIRTTNSKIYDNDEVQLAKDETFEDSNKRVVIKPLISTLGNGVMVNVNKERFKYNWSQCLKSRYGNKGKIMVQDFLEGFEARATIMLGKLISIVVRVPPHVKGDGVNSLEKLVELKNEERLQDGYLKHIPLVIDDRVIEFLRTSNLHLNYIPKKNEYILLSSVSNTRFGGELINVTDIVSEEIKELALNSLATIPGFSSGGIDIMMKSFEDKNPAVIEINSFPVIAIPTFPTYGKMENPAKYYIESYLTIDQYINKKTNKYKFKKENEYLLEYFSFLQRKEKLFKENYSLLRDSF